MDTAVCILIEGEGTAKFRPFTLFQIHLEKPWIYSRSRRTIRCLCACLKGIIFRIGLYISRNIYRWSLFQLHGGSYSIPWSCTAGNAHAVSCHSSRNHNKLRTPPSLEVRQVVTLKLIDHRIVILIFGIQLYRRHIEVMGSIDLLKIEQNLRYIIRDLNTAL